MLDFVVESPGLSSVVCLQKPFRPADLMGAIEAVTRPPLAVDVMATEGTAP
jgi:hypothetical protein